MTAQFMKSVSILAGDNIRSTQALQPDHWIPREMNAFRTLQQCKCAPENFFVCRGCKEKMPWKRIYFLLVTSDVSWYHKTKLEDLEGGHRYERSQGPSRHF